ncbi:MAG: TlpA family protein disulfide reductase [Betaproteobacteria bacterium]
MTRRRQFLVVAAVAAAAGLAGAGVHLWRLSADDSSSSLMAMRLPDLTGQPQGLSQWRGSVVVVNFWATWCAPCREEIPILISLQDKYRARGLQVVGIAIDQRDKVAAFAREFNINYVVLLGGLETIELTRQTGNRVGALPFTVVVDRNGRIVSRELGKVKETVLEREVLSLL